MLVLIGPGGCAATLAIEGPTSTTTPDSFTVRSCGTTRTYTQVAGGTPVEWDDSCEAYDHTVRVCADHHGSELCSNAKIQVPRTASRVVFPPGFEHLDRLEFVGIEQAVLTEVWNEPDEDEWDEERVPLTGWVEVQFGDGATLKADVVDGNGVLNPTTSDLESLVKGRVLKVRFGSSPSQATDWNEYDYSWLTMAGEAEVLEQYIGDNRAMVVVRNPTINKVTADVTAGYREGGSWMVGAFKGTRYYGVESFELRPGQSREVTITYPFPVLGGTLCNRVEVDMR